MGYLKKVLKDIPKKGESNKTSQYFKTIKSFPRFYEVGVSILMYILLYYVTKTE